MDCYTGKWTIQFLCRYLLSQKLTLCASISEDDTQMLHILQYFDCTTKYATYSYTSEFERSKLFSNNFQRFFSLSYWTINCVHKMHTLFEYFRLIYMNGFFFRRISENADACNAFHFALLRIPTTYLRIIPCTRCIVVAMYLHPFVSCARYNVGKNVDVHVCVRV